MLRQVFTWAALAALAGCAGNPVAPDLERLYARQAGEATPPPLIVIHGVLGGRLVDTRTDREVWPGSLRRLVFSDFDELRLAIDPDTLAPLPSTLAVSGVTDQAAGRDFYGKILTTLEDYGGYERGTLDQPAVADEKRYYVYAYDWRQDNVLTVRGLDRLVEQIRTDYGNPQLKVDIVAHSMGGLVTRYFIRYGTADVLDDNAFPVMYEGDQKVRRVILLGTPNLGSMASLDALMNGRSLVFGRLAAEVIASFPSAYQVLPHKLRNWLVDASGEPLDADVFDIEWWRRNQFGIFSPDVRERFRARYPTPAEGDIALATFERFMFRAIERGRRFSWSLTVPAPHIEQRYVVLGGSCKLTPARGLLEDLDGRPVIRFAPQDVRQRRPEINYDNLMLEPGDGTVTKASLLARQTLDPTVARHRYSFFPLGYVVFLCEDHSKLTGNPSFQDNLLNALLSAD